MASGISKAKGRRVGKTNKRGRWAGPAKAGKRKVYGPPIYSPGGVHLNKRKVRTFNSGHEGYCMWG